ncbi:MAG: YihY family inner membrane protein [Deltaproteobacteria bacterium]|nr:YihY family inner membrane protein [Deltaproteobacteria bacterium]
MKAANPLEVGYQRLMDWLRAGSDNRRLRFVKREVFVALRVARAIQNDEISRRAAALTYHTLLSLVPLMAVAFALFKAFGGFQKLQQPLEHLIFSQIPMADSHQVSEWLQGFVTQVNGGAIAGVGLLVLFYSALGLLTNVEQAFNRVWNVRLRRPLYMRLAIYWCILTLAPPIIALSVSLSTGFIKETVRAWLGVAVASLLLSLTGPVVIALVFFLIYVIVPDIHVPWKDAAVGSITAAIIWNIAKAGFVWSSSASSKYSAIYGAMSVLPLLMMWIYLSWWIVLFGASYTCARGHASKLTLEPEQEPAPPSLRILARVMVATWEHFRSGLPITTDTLAKSAGLPVGVCQVAIDTLVDKRLVDLTGREDEEGTEYLLRRHIGGLTLADLEDLLADPQNRKNEAQLKASAAWESVSRHIGVAEAARREKLQITLEQAAEQLEPTAAA